MVSQNNLNYIILQYPRKISYSSPILIDKNKYNTYLNDISLLRGRLFVEDGYLKKEDLLDGKRDVDIYDPFATHVLALDGETPIGTIRLVENNIINEHGLRLPLLNFFEKEAFESHHQTYSNFLQHIGKNGSSVSELSRLIIDKKYRKIKDLNNIIGVSIISIIYFYVIENGITDIIGATNKRVNDAGKSSTSRFKQFGCDIIKDPVTNNAVDSFYYSKFNEFAELIHVEVDHINKTAIDFFNIIKSDSTPPKLYSISE